MTEVNETEFRKAYLNPKDPKLCISCKKLPKDKPKHKCYWCGLRSETPDFQAQAARDRLEAAGPQAPRTRPAASWTPGMRYCGGCRSEVGAAYCGSSARCRGCQIVDRRTSTWKLTNEQQTQLNTMAGGQCQGCSRHQLKKGLSVDHSHYSGDIRGLLCMECNGVVGDFHDDWKRFLRLAVYLLSPPGHLVLKPEEVLPDPELERLLFKEIRAFRREMGFPSD